MQELKKIALPYFCLTFIKFFHSFILITLLTNNQIPDPMKKIFLASILLTLSFIGSYGQWYVKKYNATDINQLSREQLQESWGNTRRSIGISAICGGAGIATFVLIQLFPIEPDENPTWMEEIFGYEWENYLFKIVSAGLAVGGTIAFIVYLGRNVSIKSAIRRNFPASGSLKISPAMVLNYGTRTYCPGIRLSFSF
jgi:hypothetical protein